MKDGCDSDTVNKYMTFSKNKEIKSEKKIMSPELNFLSKNFTWTFPYHTVLNLFQRVLQWGLKWNLEPW